MGVVYRADDSRLGRKVAIKLLPNAQGEHFRRFEREARTIGSLNHPNLLTLYDVGEHDGTPFLVTEMLEGESLRARLSRGPMKMREAIQIAAEVARGLAAAHDAGIVHRDVKPDNIFLTTNGFTKILDFGIAKLRRSTLDMPAVDPMVATQSPTTADTGVIIGTPGYMAPEQLDGGTVDPRTDIFALGVVLYEMISGRRAFAAENHVEESYAILKTTPDPPKGATKALARVVMRCLEKRKDARFQSATDLAFALDELDASTDPISRISKVALDRESIPTIRDSAPPASMPVVVPWRRYTVLGLAGAVLVLGGILIGRLASKPAAPKPSWPALVEGGVAYKRVTYHTQSKWYARLAPNGTSVLYSVPRGAGEEIVRSEIGTPTILATGISGQLLDISPSGELAVLTKDVAGEGGTLVRVIEGAGPRPVIDKVTAAAWYPDGERFAVVRGGLVLEAPVGRPLVQNTTGLLNLVRVSPKGDRIAFAEHPAREDNSGRVVIVDATGKRLVTSAHQTELVGVAWSPDGDEVWFSNKSTIYALDAAGKERVLLRGVGRLELLDVRANKLLVAPSDIRLKMFTGPRAGPMREIGWFDSSEVAAVSADGSTVAFIEALGTGGTADSYGLYTRRTDQPATLIGQGNRFTLLPDASAALVIKSATSLERIPTGVGPPTQIPLGKIAQLDPSDRISVSWSGRYVVVRGAEAGSGMRLWKIDLDAPAPEPIETKNKGARHPITSDGKLVAIGNAAGGIELVGSERRVIEGPLEEEPLSFTADDSALFVMHLENGTIEVERITLATGVREPWTRITPEQRPFYYAVVLDADGDVISYSTNSDASDLYVIER